MWVVLLSLDVVGSMTFFVKSSLHAEYAKDLYQDAKQSKARLSSLADQKRNEKTQLLSASTAQKQSNSTAYSELSRSIATTQGELRAERANLARYISKGFEGQADESRKNITRLQATIDKQIASRDKLSSSDSEKTIQSVSAELDKLEMDIAGYNISDKTPEKQTSGVSSLFLWLGIESKFAEFIVNLLLSITLSVLICMINLYAEDLSFSDLRPTSPRPTKKKFEPEFENFAPAPVNFSQNRVADMFPKAQKKTRKFVTKRFSLQMIRKS
jgi:hypothetical protein